MDVTLQVSSISTEVTVTSVTTQVETQRSDATLGQVIHAEQVAELPLNGRNFVQLALLGTGTTATVGNFLSGSQSSEVSYRGSVSLSAQGMRENANDWLFDGVDNNELTAGGVSILPSIDAIREFRVLTYTIPRNTELGAARTFWSAANRGQSVPRYSIRIPAERSSRRAEFL